MDLCAKERATAHGIEIAIDVDEVMSREVNGVDFVGLEEPNSNLKRKAQSSKSTST